MNNYELAKIDYSNGLSTKEIADKYNVTVATVRKWKSRYNWESVTKKRDKSVTRQKTKEMAKILVEEGHTLKEASEQLSVNIRTLERYSSKENWMQSQKEFSQRIYSTLRKEYFERHIKNKKKRFQYLEDITEKAMFQLENDEISVDKVMNIILSSEKGETNILGVLTPEKIIETEMNLEKLELDKKKARLEQNTAEKKLDKYMDILLEAIKNE